MEFLAVVDKQTEKFNIEYFWSVKGSKIISGQGSKKILVGSTTIDAVYATVEIKGLPEKCPKFASESYMHENNSPIKRDEFSVFGRSGQKRG